MPDFPSEEDDMNFAFTTAGASGMSFAQITSGAPVPVAKLQQNVAGSGATLQQVVGMVGNDGGVQYMRTLDGGAALTATPQLITLPIALPGAKPGDPQQQIQIQVLNPNILQQQQQPKYQMQIPIQGLQGFQQGGAVLTLAYTPDTNDGGIQLIGNSLPEGIMRMRTGLQLVAMPQEMQLMQSDNKDQIQQAMQQQHVYITQNQQIVINNNEESKMNTVENNNNPVSIIIKEECDDTTNDDESSQDGTTESISWQSSNNQDLVNYLNKLPPQQAQALPASLQQFLKMNPAEVKKPDTDHPLLEIEISPNLLDTSKKQEMTEAILGEDGTLRIKKKKKYKKKPPKPAKPKPGQVVITAASDGTPIYCCPECQMAYPEKEQLEMHLSVHKIERRFICGICGAGLKRKEHLERHKLGHNPERPYVCGVCCKGFKRREHLNLHTVIHSGVKTELCKECGKGFYRKDHLRKHTRSHESKRARDESMMCDVTSAGSDSKLNDQQAPETAEITIHVPTSDNVQVPIQINIPQHVVTSLQAQQALSNNQNTLDALLAQHS